MKEKACMTCRMVVEDAKQCPNCNGTQFTTFWRGYIVILNASESALAQRMGIKAPGKYAFRLSR
ncbi:MAG: DNA-directed RNA polymerase, subunit E'' [Candidatus Diapherotrites archaeon]|nr:DNA-directed RNA polymerase, subunit E'' [Candidatus Diapherotrites archaeon]